MWRVQFTIMEPTGRKRRLSRLFKTKTDAKTFLQSLRRGERIEAAARNREMTLAEWFAWLAENDWPVNLASSTVASRKKRFEKYVAKSLGDVPLSKLDPLRIRAFYQQLTEQGVSKSLLIAIKADLVRAFNQAVSPYQRIPTSVANPFQLALSQASPREAVALTAEQVRQAITAPELMEPHRALLATLLLAGLRLGEVMALTRAQLRFHENLIVVDRAVRVEFGGKQSIGPPKGGKTRCAVMCRTLETILRSFVSGMAADHLLWPAATCNQPKMKKLFYTMWRDIAALAKLPQDMSPHDCRLTHVNLIEKLMPNVSVTTLKEHVGHAAAGVTEANYTRPLTAAQRLLRDELDRLLGPKKNRTPKA